MGAVIDLAMARRLKVEADLLQTRADAREEKERALQAYVHLPSPQHLEAFTEALRREAECFYQDPGEVAGCVERIVGYVTELVPVTAGGEVRHG